MFDFSPTLLLECELRCRATDTQCRVSCLVTSQLLRVYDRLWALVGSSVDDVGELSPPSFVQGTCIRRLSVGYGRLFSLYLLDFPQCREKPGRLMLERKRVCCRPAMDVRRAGPD